MASVRMVSIQVLSVAVVITVALSLFPGIITHPGAAR